MKLLATFLAIVFNDLGPIFLGVPGWFDKVVEISAGILPFSTSIGADVDVGVELEYNIFK